MRRNLELTVHVLVLMVFGLLVVSTANAVVLKTNYDLSAETYCGKTLNHNYYSCLNKVRSCVNHVVSLKIYMTEEERSDLILNKCFIDLQVRDQEPIY